MKRSLENIAKTHYENFPVGSIFIPKKYRTPIHYIYIFARIADDFADEGELSTEERIAKLNAWETELVNALLGESQNKFFIELAKRIQADNLPPQLFKDLLTAFRWDANHIEYKSYNDVLQYCKHSANPIGRLLLKIFHSESNENNCLSDCICTALQLTNFWQDISIDSKRNRFYIAQEDFERFHVSKSDLLTEQNTNAVQELIQFQVERTRKLFDEGKPLLKKVHRDFRLELSLIWHGGIRILEKIKQLNYDTRMHRPRLTMIDYFQIYLKARRT
ncbi:MAG: squalene synthase HpnC [Bacteroidetes bacterium]|nr:squalene synthase HpnC [Bacteroidota bacterium]